MKRNWLRGVLLGLSLAALLGGGVALAQGMYATADKTCIECQPEGGDPEPYTVHIEYGGWVAREDWWLCTMYEPPPSFPDRWLGLCIHPTDAGPLHENFGPFPCSGVFPVDGLVEDPSVLQGIEDWYGEWTFLTEQQDAGRALVDSAEASFYILEDCSVLTEFVPEPGSIALLSSGLLGLAGYATLRLRSGRALRWRTRE